MFDPVSLIVGALVSGLLAGVEASAQEAVVDGYRALRDSISQKYGGQVEASIEGLEHNPQSPQCQAAVAQQLRNAGADRDPQLVHLAENLRAIVETPERILFPPNRVEQVQRFSAFGAIGQVLDQHIGKVLSIRANHSVDDTGLLTTAIGHNGNIPRQVREGVAGLHDRIRGIIEQVAARIESQRYREVDHAVLSLQAGRSDRQRAQRLVEADKQMLVSYESLRLTVEFLDELNRNIVARIETTSSRQQLSNMMFGNAIMVYEVADFVIGYAQGFTLSDDLDQLYREAKDRVKEIRDEQRAFEGKYGSPNIPAGIRSEIRYREDVFQTLDAEWDKYISEVRQMRDMVDQARSGIVPTLEMIRENARLQIKTLQLIAMLGVLKQNSESIRNTVVTLQGFRLAPLTPSRLRRLMAV